jgi:hypothetical protein
VKVKFKEPYWIKYEWDLTSHNDNQYVTEFNKIENKELNDFLYNSQFIITCNFKIEDDYKKDDICMIFGKPGKNMGLSYNTETKSLSFEFWIDHDNESSFKMVKFKDVTDYDVENGVIVSVVKKNNKIILYKNFIKDNEIEFIGDLVEDYRTNDLYIGCSSPECDSEKQRYYCEMDIYHFSIITNQSSIERAKQIYNIDPEDILIKNYYEDILCYYNFETINNLGIVYDESKNSNFLEKVPKKYIK